MATATVRQAERVLEVRNLTGESPVWSAAEQALYWVDIPAKTLHRWSPTEAKHRVWTAPQALSCLAPTLQSGVWLAGAESGLFWVQPGAADVLSLVPYAAVQHPQPHMRFNDGKCDRQGRFWAGTMVWNDQPGGGDQVGAWYQIGLNAEGTPDTPRGLRMPLEPLRYRRPNGLAFSPDGRTVYVSDSHPLNRGVWAFDYDTATGTPSSGRPFLDMSGFQGRPDGAAIDTDGCYWICGTDSGLVHRYTPAGVLDFSVRVGSALIGMCAFGGADMRTLFIATGRPADLTDPHATDGDLFAIHLPDVQGLPEPSYAAVPSANGVAGPPGGAQFR